MIEPKIVQKNQVYLAFVYLLFFLFVYCQISYPIKDLRVSGSNIPA